MQEALEIGSRRKAYRIHRLLKASNSLIASSTYWLSPTILKGHEPPGMAELDSGSLYTWHEAECGVRLRGGQEVIEAQEASQEIAAILAVDVGTPFLRQHEPHETRQDARSNRRQSPTGLICITSNLIYL